MRLLFALALSLMAPAIAYATEPAAPAETAPARECFASSNWRGWSAGEDGDTLYLRVGLNDVYRVTLTPGSHVRKRSDRFLVNQIHGSDWICSPLDLSLTLNDHFGFRRALIARDLHKMTPEEIAALPEHDRP